MVHRFMREFKLTIVSQVQLFQVITYGATITSVKTPDRNGVFQDVALGFDNMNGRSIEIKFFALIASEMTLSSLLQVISLQPIHISELQLEECVIASVRPNFR